MRFFHSDGWGHTVVKKVSLSHGFSLFQCFPLRNDVESAVLIFRKGTYWYRFWDGGKTIRINLLFKYQAGHLSVPVPLRNDLPNLINETTMNNTPSRKDAQIKEYLVDNGGRLLTTNDGVPVTDNNTSLKAGQRGLPCSKTIYFLTSFHISTGSASPKEWSTPGAAGHTDFSR